ncbi:MAG: alpha/beta fold hydrolase [Acetobacteraceae bacterium]|nr:alpha/beta fold hydrolase [Acetobacteraceae bacterium]
MQWGRADAPAVILWHGLARTGRDFDTIAAALADQFRLICPDTPGRGLSSWSTVPDSEYCFAIYARQALALADTLGLRRFGWVGTSMGGALGIAAAATTLRDRISQLVLNDIAPTMPAAAHGRISTYIGTPPDFTTLTELEDYFRTIYAPFGAHTDAQWRHMAETGYRRLANGRITTHYDPAIVKQFHLHPRDFEQWDKYDSLRVPTLLLRGAASDLVFADVAAEMERRGPKAKRVEILGCGHAPALNVARQIEVVREFLGQGA